MDTSPEYVKMCAKAEDIQQQRPEVSLDTKTNEFWGSMQNYCQPNDVGGIDVNCVYVWLPRQDQLQEMFGPARPDALRGILKFYESDDFTGYYIEDKEMFFSYEQLWLHFVMRERFGKRWTGEEWVKS